MVSQKTDFWFYNKQREVEIRSENVKVVNVDLLIDHNIVS